MRERQFWSFLSVGSDSAKRLVKGAVLFCMVAGVLMATPYGDVVIDYLPFVGTVGEGSVVYRQEIAEASWQIIWQNPFFGSFTYLQYMQDLKQGEGIVDIVNSYAGIGLTYGLVGVALFSGFYFFLTFKTLQASRRSAAFDADFSLLGSALGAAMIGAMVMIATVSQHLSVPTVQFALAGLLGAYVKLSTQPSNSLEEVASLGAAFGEHVPVFPAHPQSR